MLNQRALELVVKARNATAAGLASAQRSIRNFSTRAGNAMRGAGRAGGKAAKFLKTHWMAVAAVITGVAMAAMKSLNAFADFEKGLANIAILMGSNTGDVKQFEKAIKELSVTYGLTTKSLLKSSFDIHSAVGNTAESLNILAAASKLAVAGGSDMDATTQGLVTLLEAYGSSLNGAADAADLLFKAQVRARATIGELSSAAGRFLPMASDLEISAEDTMAAYAKMTVSMGNYNEAATAMTGIMQGLLKPTEELQAKSQDWFDMTTQEALKQGKFLDILEEMGKVRKEELGRMLPRVRALKGLIAATKEMNETRKFAIEFANRQGITEEALKVQMETTKKKLDKVAASWHMMNIEVGGFIAKETPLISAMQNIALAMRKLPDMIRGGLFTSVKDGILDAIFPGGAEVGSRAVAFVNNAIDKVSGVKKDTGGAPTPTTPIVSGGDPWEGQSQEEFAANKKLEILRVSNTKEAELVLEGTTAIAAIMEEAHEKTAYMKEQEKIAILQGEMDKVAAIWLAETQIQEIREAAGDRYMELLAAQQEMVKKVALANAQAIMSSTAQTMGSVASLFEIAQGESKKYAMVIKALRVGEAIINTAVAVTAALAAPPGWPLNMMGVISAGAAGAVQVATIMSQGFAAGTDSVPASLTPGEMVVPKSFASAIRAGNLTLGGPSGGGESTGAGSGNVVNHNYYIQAVDAPSFANLVQSNPEAIEIVVGRAVMNNTPLRGAMRENLI